MNSNAKEIEELPGGWVRCRSKSNPGRQYFFNRRTGKSSWTEPQPGENSNKKSKKKESPKQSQQKKQAERSRNKSVKRKSDGSEAGSSKKSQKIVTPEKDRKKASPKQAETRANLRNRTKSPSKTETPSKRLSFNDSKQKVTPHKRSPSKTPTKNAANKRLSDLRAQLDSETRDDDNEPTSKKSKAGLVSDTNETPRPRAELPSPNVSESIGSTAKSPSSDSLHSIPSPSQFFAANKIICAMKAQLPEEFCSKEKAKDTFADIEQGICSQMTDYPVIKHPSTPPQFSEASKLVSAIKSKLCYTPKEVKTFTSAKERMEALRASISGEIDEEDLRDVSNNDSFVMPTGDSLPAVPHTPEICEAMEVEEIKEAVEVAKLGLPKDKDPANGQVVLVVDTNIFIHELDFIKTVLNSHIKGYNEQPMLLVPWRVINELDRLKDNNNGNGALCKRARAAMDYLYKSLPENNRIKGQSLRDANSHIYPCELPDDEILNCALQQTERGRNVLLLSNDRNLCNKASVNGVRRLGLAELRPLVEQRAAPRADPGLRPRLHHCQHTVHQLLANILENEMRAKYNNLWLHVVARPPPWRLADVLHCLLKHWVAVFSEVFPRIQHLVADLAGAHDRIEGKDPSALTESEVESFKELCAEVAGKCQIIPEYMELAKRTVGRLARGASGTDDDERARQIVVSTFEALWNVMSSYCAKLATALGVPHSVEDTIPVNETLMNLTGKFGDFNGSILNLVVTIEGVLNMSEPSSMDERTARLEAAFVDCLKLTPHSTRPTRHDLRAFCLTNRAYNIPTHVTYISNMLQEAVNKFSHLGQLLDLCKGKLQQTD